MTKRYIRKSELLGYLYRQNIDIKMSASRYFDEQFAAMCILAGIWLPSVKLDMALASPNCSDDMEERIDRQTSTRCEINQEIRCSTAHKSGVRLQPEV
jgi:hypothetical protein